MKKQLHGHNLMKHSSEILRSRITDNAEKSRVKYSVRRDLFTTMLNLFKSPSRYLHSANFSSCYLLRSFNSEIFNEKV